MHVKYLLTSMPRPLYLHLFHICLFCCCTTTPKIFQINSPNSWSHFFQLPYLIVSPLNSRDIVMIGLSPLHLLFLSHSTQLVTLHSPLLPEVLDCFTAHFHLGGSVYIAFQQVNARSAKTITYRLFPYRSCEHNLLCK